MYENDRGSVSRRQFLLTGSAFAAGSALGDRSTTAMGGMVQRTMKYRRFGRTGINISEVGLGCASGLRSNQLGEELFNRYREELPAIVLKLMELGGNFVATSASYHDTEEILGRTLVGRRREMFIFTATGASDAKKVVSDCHRSLKRFQTDALDGYFCHGGWSEGFLEAAQQLKQQGKIRFVGMSCHVPAKHRVCVEAGSVDFILQPYNYLNLAKWTEKTDRAGTEELFELCAQKDVGVMAIKPMTGHYVPNWAKNAADPKVAALMTELKTAGKKSLYEAFLMWTLHNPRVSCAAVGMNTIEDAVEDCGSVGQTLTERHWRLLDLYAAAATNDYCRMCETCMPSCPRGIRIADILRYRMYHKNYGHRADAREYYAAVPESQRVPACDGCGICECTCPNKLRIVEKLREAHSLLA